jgi:phosphoenolpyruvate carboxykinase (GTP)
MRVLKWIVDRCQGRAAAVESPLGWMPTACEIVWDGLPGDAEAQFREAMTLDREEWMRELLLHEELFLRLYDRLPKEFVLRRELLLATLWRAPERWTLPA